MPKQYLTVKEIAKLFGVTPLTIRNWDKRGSLSAYRNPMNNYRMYKVEDVESLFKRITQSKTRNQSLPSDLPVVPTETLVVEEKPKARKLTIYTE